MQEKLSERCRLRHTCARSGSSGVDSCRHLNFFGVGTMAEKSISQFWFEIILRITDTYFYRSGFFIGIAASFSKANLRTGHLSPLGGIKYTALHWLWYVLANFLAIRTFFVISKYRSLWTWGHMSRHKEILPSPPRLLKFLAKWMWILSEVKCLPFPFFESPQSRWKAFALLVTASESVSGALINRGKSRWILHAKNVRPFLRPLFPDEASLPNYQVKLSGQEKKKVLFFFPTLLSPSRAPPPKLPPSPRPRFFFL